MPIYEYECDKCGVTFEAMQTMSAKPLKTCNGLGCDDKDNGKVRLIVSASGFILKGSGWYTSEYPSEARKKGWEQEGKQSKGKDDAAPAPAVDAKTPAADKKEKAEPAPAAPAKKSTAKSPYSSGKSKKAKGSK
ncbi:MAG: zinc ribbon domain-containing protein [Nitrospinaceae bacterium]|nr:zinc ribbon domain-containing protein [Nitrospinaceae bacterium]